MSEQRRLTKQEIFAKKHKRKLKICTECDSSKIRADGRRGGYNHVDCRNGKKDKKGKLQVCECWCQKPDSKYNLVLPRIKI